MGTNSITHRSILTLLAAYLGLFVGLVDANALHGKPAVLVDRRHARMHTDFVSVDNPAAMKAVCNHLLEGGHSELLYITEPLRGVSSRRERTAAFNTCIEAHERGQVRIHGQVFESVEGGDEALVAALRGVRKRALRGRRAAVIAGNAVITLRVAGAMARLDWQFGRELGFVGFDDPEWASLIGPGLTAISQPTDEIGRTAAACLLERLGGLEAPPRQMLLRGTLIVRGSSL